MRAGLNWIVGMFSMDIDTVVSLLIRSNGVLLVACVLLLLGAFSASFIEPPAPATLRRLESEDPPKFR